MLGVSHCVLFPPSHRITHTTSMLKLHMPGERRLRSNLMLIPACVQGLLNFNLPVTEPLYVSADWAKTAPELSELVLKKLQVYKVKRH